MGSTKLVIQQNNELREDLTKENLEYYEKMLVYIRTKSWLKDERKIEEILIEVLQDLITAQEEGVSAEDYFGKDPQASADELLSNIDRSWFGGLKMLLSVFGISIMLSILNNIISGGSSFDLTSILFRTIYLYLCVTLVMKFLQNDSYGRKNSKLQEGLYLIGFLTILTTGPLIEATILPSLLVFTMPLSVSFGLYILVVLLSTWTFFKLPSEERKPWLLMLLFVWGALIFGIVNTL